MKGERISLVALAAMLAHEANRAYCESLGDESQLPWEDSPDWQKESALAGAGAILADPPMSPEASHEEWFKLKEDDGWVWGEVKDSDAKTHPCMVEYDELPADQQMKDTLFGAVVRAVLFNISGDSDLADTLGTMTPGELAEHGLCRVNQDESEAGPMTATKAQAAYDDLCEARPERTRRDEIAEKLMDGKPLKRVSGASADGVGGVLVFYDDGSTARYVMGHGWTPKDPVPGTYAAWVVAIDAAVAAEQDAAEEEG